MNFTIASDRTSRTPVAIANFTNQQIPWTRNATRAALESTCECGRCHNCRIKAAFADADWLSGFDLEIHLQEQYDLYALLFMKGLTL